MTDHKGKTIKKAGPATAVEILGLTDVPEAGDEFNAVKDDKTAREIAGHRQEKLREEVLARNSSTTLEKLFSQIQEGEVKELNLIIKADVQGSVGATISSLEKLNNDAVKVNVIHSGVGTVTESDVMLAETSNAVIIGFNVRPSSAVTSMYSAIKVNGKRLYDYARAGEAVEIPCRDIFISDLVIEEMRLGAGYDSYVTFSAECTKGTYIRSICRDAGENIGVHGTMRGHRCS